MRKTPLVLALATIMTLGAVSGAYAISVSKDNSRSLDISKDQKLDQNKSQSVKDAKGRRSSKSDQLQSTSQGEEGARDSQTNQMGLETSAFSLMLPILKRIEEGGDLKGMDPYVRGMIRQYRPLSQNSLAQKNIALQNLIMPLERCALAEDPKKDSAEAEEVVQAMTNHAAGLSLYTQLVHRAYKIIGKQHGNIGDTVNMRSVVPNAQRVAAEALIAASKDEIDTTCKATYHFQGSAIAQARTQYVSIRNQAQNIANQQSRMAFIGAFGPSSMMAGKDPTAAAAQWEAQAKNAALILNTLQSPASCPVVLMITCDLPIGKAHVSIEQDQLMVAGSPQWGGDQGMIMGTRLTLSENRNLEKHISVSDSDSQSKTRTRESYVSKDTDITTSESHGSSFSRKSGVSASTKATIDASANPFK